MSRQCDDTTAKTTNQAPEIKYDRRRRDSDPTKNPFQSAKRVLQKNDWGLPYPSFNCRPRCRVTREPAGGPLATACLQRPHGPAAGTSCGDLVAPTAGSETLAAGANPLLLRYDQIGRGYFVVGVGKLPRFDPLHSPGSPGTPPWNVDLATRWYRDANVMPFDTRPDIAHPAGWYRVVSPPGLRGMTIPTRAKVQAWAAGTRRLGKGWRVGNILRWRLVPQDSAAFRRADQRAYDARPGQRRGFRRGARQWQDRRHPGCAAVDTRDHKAGQKEWRAGM